MILDSFLAIWVSLLILANLAVSVAKPGEVDSKMTLIKANLETGRTHQIRVHMKYLGYPLLGDLTYGNESKEIKKWVAE